MKTFIVTLRIIGLISFAALCVLYAGPVRKISLPYEFAYWACLASFGTAFLIRLFSTSFFGYLRRDERLEVE